jgi:hypothetical protein
MTVILMPAVLAAKQCYDYCGGQPIFEELLAAHGDMLKPCRTTPRGDAFYRRATLDATIAVAEAQGTLIAEPLDKPAKVLKKVGRRFRPADLA